MTNQPKISVVTVVLNAATVVEDTLKSVVNQTYSNLEYIVIDGGSKDGTLDIINRYRGRIAVLVSETDEGIFHAMNKGLAKVSADYVSFMNAGDRFHDDRVLEDVAKHLAENLLVLCGDTRIEYRWGSSRVFKARLSLYDMPTYHQAMLFHKKFYEISGPHIPKYRYNADFDLWQKVYFKHPGRIKVIRRLISVNNLEGISNQHLFKVCKERVDVSINNLPFSHKPWILLANGKNLLKFSLIFLLRRMGLYETAVKIRHRC